MRAGRECMQAGDWAGAIRAYGQGLMEHPSWACTTPPTWSAPALDTGKSARRSTSKTLNTPRWWWLPLS
jgi:hypothetical protein